MQVSSNPALSLRESSDCSVLRFAAVPEEIEEIFSSKLSMTEGKQDLKTAAEEESDGEFEGVEEVFSFECMNPDRSPISADDIFQDGQIRPLYPLFDGELRRRLENAFAEARDGDCASSDSEDPEGPYCPWTKKSAGDSGEACRKSNSTGFSKLRRFREMVLRSKSDGKNAFVFLQRDEKSRGKLDDSAASTAEGEKNGKRPPPKSAHERLYVRNRATKEELKRKSYLPYRVGFFTRNVHPY